MTTRAQPESGYIETNGAKIYYEVAGAGYPVVLVHAGVADHTMWDEQMGPFTQKYRVIRYDTRGFGRSITEEVEFSNRQDLYDLLTGLGVEKAHVVGNSRGGQIALDFAIERPEMVSALVLVAAGLSGFTPPNEPTGIEKTLWAAEEKAWDAADWEGVADIDVQMWADGPGQPAGRAPSDLRERVRKMCLNTYTTHKAEGKPQPLDPPAAGRLGEVKAPTLIMYGDLDTSGTPATSEQMAQGIKGSKKIVYPGVAHMVSMELPDEFNRVVLVFFEEVEAGDVKRET